MDETSEKMPAKISGKGATPWLEDAWQPLGRLRGDGRMIEDFFSALPSPFSGRRGTAAPFRPLEGMLVITLPKNPQAAKMEKKIEIKAN